MDLNKRLCSIIEKNKQANPEYIKKIIKSDFFYLINNYFEVRFDDVDVQIDLDQDKYIISINTLGERMKTMKIVPE